MTSSSNNKTRPFRLSLKSKIISLAIAPLIVATSIITYLSLQSARDLAEEELAIYEYNLVEEKRKALKSHVSLAMSAITPVLDNEELPDEVAKQRVRSILTNLRYEDDGYFFVYDQAGVNIVHPTQPNFVGKNLWAYQDRNGNYLIQGLIREAQAGGGFHRYIWEKPPFMAQEDKLSYVIEIERWNWTMGTGIYLDDIYAELAMTQATMNRNIQDSFNSVIVVVVTTVIFVILLGLVINLHENRQADSRLKELAQRFMRLQVNERRGFSRELHDGINQLLVSCKFRIELAGNKLFRQSDEEAVQGELQKASDLIAQTIGEVRQISHNLRPMLLDDLGLEATLRSLIDQFSERTNIEVTYFFNIHTQITDDVEITIYRLTQEALTNIEKHARATQVALQYFEENQHIQFECRDNGRGITKPKGSVSGIGFINMRERLELIGGELNIESQRGRGTKIHGVFPV